MEQILRQPVISYELALPGKIRRKDLYIPHNREVIRFLAEPLGILPLLDVLSNLKRPFQQIVVSPIDWDPVGECVRQKESDALKKIEGVGASIIMKHTFFDTDCKTPFHNIVFTGRYPSIMMIESLVHWTESLHPSGKLVFPIMVACNGQNSINMQDPLIEEIQNFVDFTSTNTYMGLTPKLIPLTSASSTGDDVKEEGQQKPYLVVIQRNSKRPYKKIKARRM